LSKIFIVQFNPSELHGRVLHHLTLLSTHHYAHDGYYHQLRKAREHPNSRKEAGIKAKQKFVGHINEET